MVEVYFNLVKEQKRTCNPKNKSVPQVPAKWLAEVKALLKERGYDNDGNILDN